MGEEEKLKYEILPFKFPDINKVTPVYAEIINSLFTKEELKGIDTDKISNSIIEKVFSALDKSGEIVQKMVILGLKKTMEELKDLDATKSVIYFRKIIEVNALFFSNITLTYFGIASSLNLQLQGETSTKSSPETDSPAQS